MRADWDQWVQSWHAEVQRCNGVAPPEGKHSTWARKYVRQPQKVLKTVLKPLTGVRHPPHPPHIDPVGVVAEALAPQDDEAPVPTFSKALEAEVFVVELKDQTHKGITYMAQSACEQVEAFLQGHPGVFDRFSIIAHSFGGVYSKALLNMRPHHPNFAVLRPMNFVTLASPHLSCCSRRSRVHLELLGKAVLSQTAKDLLLEDPEKLLLACTLDSMPHLRQFCNWMTYSNTVNDVLVPYGTSAIQIQRGRRHAACACDNGVIIAVHRPDRCECFHHDDASDSNNIHFEEPLEFLGHHLIPRPLRGGSSSPEDLSSDILPTPKLPKHLDNSQGKHIRAMYEELNTLPWVRVDVCIHHVRAHEYIHLKSKHRVAWLLPIVQHVLENFVF